VFCKLIGSLVALSRVAGGKAGLLGIDMERNYGYVTWSWAISRVWFSSMRVEDWGSSVVPYKIVCYKAFMKVSSRQNFWNELGDVWKTWEFHRDRFWRMNWVEKLYDSLRLRWIACEDWVWIGESGHEGGRWIDFKEWLWRCDMNRDAGCSCEDGSGTGPESCPLVGTGY
jgi:hypothetical protein